MTDDRADGRHRRVPLDRLAGAGVLAAAGHRGSWRGGRVLVVAAHPDDEVLGVGGLLAVLAGLGADLRLLWATDGEASHPRSTAEPARRLASIRRAESAVAAERLGLAAVPRIHLGLPDGGLGRLEDELTERIADQVGPDDVVLAPWSGDGHPDHEACGRAAGAVAADAARVPRLGVALGSAGRRPGAVDAGPPGRPRRRRRGTGRQPPSRASGRRCEPIGPEPADGPVLPDRVLAHFRRDHEVVLA